MTNVVTEVAMSEGDVRGTVNMAQAYANLFRGTWSNRACPGAC
jgi:hypothetical protein